MSSEKGAEVVGCDASIMKNVWEIRVREYGAKQQLEQERIEKSALPVINKDWENRLAARVGGYKRTERKAKRQAEAQPDDSVWKSKPQTPRIAPSRTAAPHGGSAPPRGGSAPLGRPGIPGKGPSVPTPAIVQDKSVLRKQMLMYMTQTLPSMMVWGKAWKYNKSLTTPAAGSTPDSNWGHCWMFATQQPPSKEEGKPWSSDPNVMDPHTLPFWSKQESRLVESEQLDLSLPAEEWQQSWQRPNKIEKKLDEEGGPKAWYFTKLIETQHHNESLYSSEWSDSWNSTKPGNQLDQSTSESKANNQGNEADMNPEWEECWKLTNHHGGNDFKPVVLKALGPQWANSWKAATVGLNNLNTANQIQGSDGPGLQMQSQFNTIKEPHSFRYRNLSQHFHKDLEAQNEWTKSWQVTKNNSKPCEEIEKVLKAPPPKSDTAKGGKKASEEDFPMPPDPRYQQLRKEVIHYPTRDFPQSKLFLLQQLQKMLPSSDWKDSWKMIKHRRREERRRMRPDSSKPFGELEKGGDKKPTASEWKNSWKYTCKPLNQNPEEWQQTWSTTNQIRVNWERNRNDFEPVQFPKNGPTGGGVWAESWKFLRRQHKSEAGQIREQTSQGKSNVPFHQPDSCDNNVRRTRSFSDWQQAWMFSENQFRDDRPSLIQWREAWKWSVYHTLPWADQEPRDKWVDEASEFQQRKKLLSVERVVTKMSRSFDQRMFRERYPEEEWSSSWNGESVLFYQPSYYGSSGDSGHGQSNRVKQVTPLVSECGSVWGRSFRFANPMPKVKQPWVKSTPNPAYYSLFWSKEKKTQSNKYNIISSNAGLKLWASSYMFLQGASGQTNNKRRSVVTSDRREIYPKMTRARKSLYSDLEKEKDKQLEKRWAGVHLWSKAQPRPKKGRGSGKKVGLDDAEKDKYHEEWMESWRVLTKPKNVKMQMSYKLLSGWDDSWLYLFPPYLPIVANKCK